MLDLVKRVVKRVIMSQFRAGQPWYTPHHGDLEFRSKQVFLVIFLNLCLLFWASTQFDSERRLCLCQFFYLYLVELRNWFKNKGFEGILGDFLIK